MSRANAVRVAVPIATTVVGFLALKLLDPSLLSRERLFELLAPLGDWTPVVFVALLAVRPLTLLPGHVFNALGGILFGGLVGSLLALLGNTLGAVVSFFVGRWVGKPLLRRWLKRKVGPLAASARRNDFLFAFFLTLNPLMPTDPAIALAGGAGANFWRTMLGKLAAVVPGTVATVYFGSALNSGNPLWLGLSIVALVASAVGGFWVSARVYRDVRSGRPASKRALPSQSAG